MTINQFKKVITLLAGSTAYIYLFYRLLSKENITQILPKLQLNIWSISLIILLWFLYILAQGFYLSRVFNKWKIKLSLKESSNIWLASVALGIITFGLGGLAVLIIAIKKRTANLDKKTVAKITFDYYAGYVSSVILLIILTFILISHLLILKILLPILLFLIIFIIWRKLGWFLILEAFPAVILNLLLFTYSFRLLQIHLPIIDYLKAFNVNIFLALASPSGGGLGFVEIGLMKYLEYTGISSQSATLATLLYRSISLWLTAAVGYISLIKLTHSTHTEGK